MPQVDWTTYSKIDDGVVITFNAIRATVTGISRALRAIFWKDYGVGFFNAAQMAADYIFNHSLASTQGLWISYLLSQVGGIQQQALQGVSDHMYIQHNPGTTGQTRVGAIRRGISGTIDGRDDSALISLGTRAIEVLARVGNTVTVIVYTDAAKTGIQETLNFTSVAAIPDYRHHYGINNRSGAATNDDGYVEYYNLGPDVAANIPVSAFEDVA